jgi:hypothetical protein
VRKHTAEVFQQREERATPARWAWLREWWGTVRARRVNNRQLHLCLQQLEAAGIFAESPDCAALCEHIAAWRQRPIRLVAYPFVRTISGLVVARSTYDVIYFAEQVHPILGMQAILHELAHLLLGHVQGAPTPETGEQLTPLDIQTALKRSCYDHAREIQAERMAYLLRQHWLDIRPPAYTMRHGVDVNEDEQRAWERFTTYLNPLDVAE